MVYWHCVLIVIPDGAEGATFALSVVFLVFLPPLGFLFYRILYRAGRKEKAALYLVYLCFLTLEMIVWLFFMIGPPSSGAVGFYIIKQTFAKSVAVGIIIIINVVFWAAIFVWSIVIFWKVRNRWRAAGGTKASKEQAVEGAVNIAKDNPELVGKAVKKGVEAST